MTAPELVRPEFTVAADAYRFAWPGVEITLDGFVERRGDLTAEMTVRSTDPATKGLVYQARFNLGAGNARKQVAEMLDKRLEYDWGGALEQLCYMALARWREGDPVIDLRSADPSARRWLLRPYLEAGAPTVMFAYGGAGKSILALAMAYTVAAGSPRFVGSTDGKPRPVLYLDWETDAAEHSRRLRAMAAARRDNAPPSVFYKRMTGSLPEAAPTIRKEIGRLRAALVVVDSLGYAGGAAPEEAQTAIALFGALRTFGTSALCIHHRRKTMGSKGSDPESLFGSAYYFNSARHVWQLQGAKDEGAESIAIAMIHAKSNNGRLQPRHGYTLRFANDADDMVTGITFRYQENLAAVPALADHATLKDRIAEELGGGAMTVDELCQALDAKKGTVQARISELRKEGKVVSVLGSKWGLPVVED